MKVFPTVTIKTPGQEDLTIGDARCLVILEYLDRCRQCQQEFVTNLHVRHQCGECNLKKLYPPDGIRPQDRPSLWKRFTSWLERE